MCLGVFIRSMPHELQYIHISSGFKRLGLVVGGSALAAPLTRGGPRREFPTDTNRETVPRSLPGVFGECSKPKRAGLGGKRRQTLGVFLRFFFRRGARAWHLVACAESRRPRRGRPEEAS